MSDVVVTVPQWFTLERWIAEGDPAGTPWSGQEWHFYLFGPRPQIQPGERVYIVFGGVLRGYAPLIRIDPFAGNKYGLVRHGDAVAVSVPFPIPGFQGFKERWWEYSRELPFPDWKNPKSALFDRRIPRKVTSQKKVVKTGYGLEELPF